MADQEEKNKKVGLAVSVGIHALVLLAFFFILAWRAPDPPLPDYGIELNFGMDNAGSGEEQPITPASESEEENTESPQQEVENEPVQEEAEVVPAPEPAPISPVAESKVTQNVVSQPAPSPVTKEEVKKPEPKPKPVTKTEPVKDVKKEEPKKETAKPALFPSDTKNTAAAKANQGDKADAVGDQGSKEGSLDSRALYGEQGGGSSGPTLSISGWRWDEAPNKKDQSTENGKIVFRFKIDDQGYVVEANTIETTVSPKVTQFYKEQLLRTTFSPTSDNAMPAATTTGTVTFVIKAR